jgi:hypothetical protein
MTRARATSAVGPQRATLGPATKPQRATLGPATKQWLAEVNATVSLGRATKNWLNNVRAKGGFSDIGKGGTIGSGTPKHRRPA